MAMHKSSSAPVTDFILTKTAFSNSARDVPDRNLSLPRSLFFSMTVFSTRGGESKDKVVVRERDGERQREGPFHCFLLTTTHPRKNRTLEESKSLLPSNNHSEDVRVVWMILKDPRWTLCMLRGTDNRVPRATLAIVNFFFFVCAEAKFSIARGAHMSTRLRHRIPF